MITSIRSTLAASVSSGADSTGVVAVVVLAVFVGGAKSYTRFRGEP